MRLCFRLRARASAAAALRRFPCGHPQRLRPLPPAKRAAFKTHIQTGAGYTLPARIGDFRPAEIGCFLPAQNGDFLPALTPIQKIRGFFQWKNGNIEKLKGYFIYDDVGKPIKIEQLKENKTEPPPVKKSKTATGLIALLCVSTVFFAFSIFSLHGKYEEQLRKQEEILNDLSAQGAIINSQADTIEKMQEQLVNGVLDPSGQTTAADLIEMLENHEITLRNQEKVLEELKNFVENSKQESNEARFTIYTVVDGDTLAKICSEHGLDYKTNINIIIELNGIKDANLIYVGQKLLLPIDE